MKTIAVIYDDFARADQALSSLRAAGVAPDQINVVSGLPEHDVGTGDPARRRYQLETGETIAAGESGTVGIGGFALAAGLLTIPAVGPILALGPLAVGSIGAGVASQQRGLETALRRLGVDKADASAFAEVARDGATLVVLTAHEADVGRFVDILEEHGPADLEARRGRIEPPSHSDRAHAH